VIYQEGDYVIIVLAKMVTQRVRFATKHVYDNEYTSIIDIYFYEDFLYSQTLSACTSDI
jgi:hypothetical protein